MPHWEKDVIPAAGAPNHYSQPAEMHRAAPSSSAGNTETEDGALLPEGSLSASGREATNAPVSFVRSRHAGSTARSQLHGLGGGNTGLSRHWFARPSRAGVFGPQSEEEPASLSLDEAIERIIANLQLQSLRIEFDQHGAVKTENLPEDIAMLFKMADARPGFDTRPSVRKMTDAAGFHNYEFPCAQAAKGVALDIIVSELENRVMDLEMDPETARRFPNTMKQTDMIAREKQVKVIQRYKSEVSMSLILNKTRPFIYTIIAAWALKYLNVPAADAMRKIGIHIVSEYVAWVLHEDGVKWVKQLEETRAEYFQLKDSLPPNARFSTEEGRALLLDIVKAKLDEVRNAQKGMNASPAVLGSFEHVLLLGVLQYALLLS